MSVEYLTFAEQVYFNKFSEYRRAVLEWLAERNLPLRLASVEVDAAHVSAYAGLMNKIKGASQGRGRKTIKWRFIKRRK